MRERQAELFRVLGVDSRIRIIELLKEKGPIGVKEMSEVMGITPSAVSQHLKVLRHAGLVRSERKGYWIPYAVDPVALENCAELISQVCTCGCEGTCPATRDALTDDGDRLAALRRRAQALETEIDQVRRQIRELEKKG